MEFAIKTRPKKPSEDGCLSHTLYNGMTVTELNVDVKRFMEKYPHLTTADITFEHDCEDGYYEITLQAAGKPPDVRRKEMNQYKKDLKAYNLWRIENEEEIKQFKETEKKRIAQDKLLRAKARAEKELEGILNKLDVIV